MFVFKLSHQFVHQKWLFVRRCWLRDVERSVSPNRLGSEYRRGDLQKHRRRRCRRRQMFSGSRRHSSNFCGRIRTWKVFILLYLLISFFYKIPLFGYLLVLKLIVNFRFHPYSIIEQFKGELPDWMFSYSAVPTKIVSNFCHFKMLKNSD